MELHQLEHENSHDDGDRHQARVDSPPHKELHFIPGTCHTHTQHNGDGDRHTRNCISYPTPVIHTTQRGRWPPPGKGRLSSTQGTAFHTRHLSYTQHNGDGDRHQARVDSPPHKELHFIPDTCHTHTQHNGDGDHHQARVETPPHKERHFIPDTCHTHTQHNGDGEISWEAPSRHLATSCIRQELLATTRTPWQNLPKAQLLTYPASDKRQEGCWICLHQQRNSKGLTYASCPFHSW